MGKPTGFKDYERKTEPYRDPVVRLVDFKTGRSVPADESGVITPYLRQMAHYVAALEAIFPDRVVEASLLYTHAPRLIRLTDALLAPHKPASAL